MPVSPAGFNPQARQPTGTARAGRGPRAQSQARCANRYEPRSSLACPRPATSPLRACPPPLASVAPHIACRVARFARPPLPATAARQLPRLASRVAALRASAGVTHAIPPRARSACGACLRAPVRECGAPRIVAASSPRCARPRRVRLRLRLRLALAAARNHPLHLPPLRARRRRQFATILPLPPCCPVHFVHRSPPASNGSRCSRPPLTPYPNAGSPFPPE